MNSYMPYDDVNSPCMAHIVEQLNRIETMLTDLADQRTAKDFYTTADIAAILD